MGYFIKNRRTHNLIYTTNLGYTKATHYILTYQKSTNDRIFRTEIFYKKYDDLIKTEPVSYYTAFTIILAAAMPGELNFFGEIKKVSKTLTTGSVIPTWIPGVTILTIRKS